MVVVSGTDHAGCMTETLPITVRLDTISFDRMLASTNARFLVLTDTDQGCPVSKKWGTSFVFIQKKCQSLRKRIYRQSAKRLAVNSLSASDIDQD